MPFSPVLWIKANTSSFNPGSKTKTDYFWSPVWGSGAGEHEYGGNPHGKFAHQQTIEGPDELITTSNHFNQYKLHQKLK